MRTLVLIATLLTLVGCKSTIDRIFGEPFVPEFDRGPNVKIEYIYVETQAEITKWCGTTYDGKKQILGCANIPPVPDFPCYVVTYKNHLPDVKEHEERHCRYGRYHPT